MQTQSNSQRWVYLALALLLMVLPAVVFYVILWKNAVRIPILDDYDIVLGAVNSISTKHDFLSQLFYVLTAQHNGYKLMFENVIVLGQFGLFGQVSFLPLVALGNAFALLIVLTVCAMFRAPAGDLAKRLLLLVPVAYLLFQLQYASALDFASSSLQHLAVIFFSLLSIYLLSKDSRWSTVCSCISVIFAIASSPNGFFVVPVGLLMMAQTRRWWRMPAWITAAGLMLGVYFYKYVNPPSSAMQHGSAVTLTHFNVLYALSFVGSSAARYVSLGPSLLLGAILCGIFLLAVKRRYFKQNPAVFYSMLFILINALAVSGLRSDLGMAQSLASRYRTYSNLLLAFSYIFLIENLLPVLKRKSFRRGVLAGVGVLSVVFCALSDVAGGRFLDGKKEALTHNYGVEWLKDPSAAKDPKVTGNPALLHQMDAGVYEINLPVLQESVRLGVYRPPQNEH